MEFAFALATFYGEEAAIAERAVDEAGSRDGGDDAGWSREDGVGDFVLDCGFEEAHAWVGDAWHACVGDDGDGGTVAELLDEVCGAHGLVVLVIGDEGFVDAVVLQEDSGVACVFGGDEVDGAEGIEGAESDVGEVADGGCDEVEHVGGFTSLRRWLTRFWWRPVRVRLVGLVGNNFGYQRSGGRDRG